MQQDNSWKRKTLILGGVIGLLTGLAAAYILVQRAEKDETTRGLSAGEGVKLGLGVLGLLRLLTDGK